MSNTTATKKLVGVFALWKRKSKSGNVYFSGKTEGGENLTAFYVTEKKNLKEPDMRVYTKDSEGNLSDDVFCSLWCNATKNGKKVLSGKLNGKKLIGFIKADASEKQPYVSVYYQEESEAPKEDSEAPKEKKSDKKSKPSKKEPEFEEVEQEELPF